MFNLIDIFHRGCHPSRDETSPFPIDITTNDVNHTDMMVLHPFFSNLVHACWLGDLSHSEKGKYFERVLGYDYVTRSAIRKVNLDINYLVFW